MAEIITYILICWETQLVRSHQYHPYWLPLGLAILTAAAMTALSSRKAEGGLASQA
jgi:hypothetical protein